MIILQYESDSPRHNTLHFLVAQDMEAAAEATENGTRFGSIPLRNGKEVDNIEVLVKGVDPKELANALVIVSRGMLHFCPILTK